MTPSELAIVDAHVHFWDPATTPRPGSPFVRLLGWNPPLLHRVAKAVLPSAARAYVGKPEILFAPYMPEAHRRAFGRHRLRGLVHVQAGWLAPFAMGPVGETRWLERIGGDDLLGIVAHADLTMGRGLSRVLIAHRAASARLRGVRHLLAHSRAPGVMSWTRKPAHYEDSGFREGYAMLAQHGLRFDAWMYHHQLKGFAALARVHPEVPVVLCHAGTPPGLGGPFGDVGRTAEERVHIHAEWREGMAALAALPHVHVKLSGLTMPVLGFGFHERETPPSAALVAEALGPLVREVVDLFGEDRCMFASNFPMDSVSAPLETIVDGYLLALADRSPVALAKIFAGNAARFYDIPM